LYIFAQFYKKIIKIKFEETLFDEQFTLHAIV